MSNIPKYIKKHWKPIIFSICLIVFVIITRLLIIDKITTFDNTIYKIITYYKNDLLTSIFKFFTFLCSAYFIIITTILIMIFIKNKKTGYYIALNVLLCFLLNQAMKLVFIRERPTLINIIEEKGYSFPSGHSMISLAFYGFLAYLIYHSKITKNTKRLLVIPLIILPIIIGISRIYLGVHYASDVLAGLAISSSYLILYIIAYKKIG